MHLRECLSDLSDVTERALRACEAVTEWHETVVPVCPGAAGYCGRTTNCILRRSIRWWPTTGRACACRSWVKYSLHRQTAKAHLERRGVTIRSEMPTMTPEQVQAAGQLYEATGLSLAQVAAGFEVAPSTLRRAIGRAGFRIHGRGYAGPRLKERGL